MVFADHLPAWRRPPLHLPSRIQAGILTRRGKACRTPAADDSRVLSSGRDPVPARMPEFALEGDTMHQQPAVVVFSHLRWDFVWQRPQHVLTRLARSRRVLFVEE